MKSYKDAIMEQISLPPLFPIRLIPLVAGTIRYALAIVIGSFLIGFTRALYRWLFREQSFQEALRTAFYCPDVQSNPLGGETAQKEQQQESS